MSACFRGKIQNFPIHIIPIFKSYTVDVLIEGCSSVRMCSIVLTLEIKVLVTVICNSVISRLGLISGQ